jgi:hypothetical protein
MSSAQETRKLADGPATDAQTS